MNDYYFFTTFPKNKFFNSCTYLTFRGKTNGWNLKEKELNFPLLTKSVGLREAFTQYFLVIGSFDEGWIKYHIIICSHSFIKWLRWNEVHKLEYLNRWNTYTLHVHYAHAAADLNRWYSKYAKVACLHYFCTTALRTYTFCGVAGHVSAAWRWFVLLYG